MEHPKLAVHRYSIVRYQTAGVTVARQIREIHQVCDDSVGVVEESNGRVTLLDLLKTVHRGNNLCDDLPVP